MKLLRLVLVGCLVVGLCAAARAQEKASNKDKIVGTWEIVKDDTSNPAPPGARVEFTKDGKITFTAKVQGRTISQEGTYKVDGDKLIITAKGRGGQEQSHTDMITKLTDKQLILKTGGDKKNVEFKRVSK